MDRAKPGPGRGGKGKTPQFPADLYALGSKSSGEAKRPGPVNVKPVPSHSALSGVDRKRESSVPSSAALVPPKKTKLTSVLRPPTTSAIGSATGDTWEAMALDAEPSDLMAHITEANNAGDQEKMIGLVCGAVRAVRSQRHKPDPVVWHSLVLAAKQYPAVFATEQVTAAVTSLLRPRTADHSAAFKPGAGGGVKGVGGGVTPALAVSLLLRAFKDSKRWPHTFITLYMEDSMGERAWVDSEQSKAFVDNIVASLGTRPLPAMEAAEGLGGGRPAEEAEPSALMSPYTAALDKDRPDVHATPRFNWNIEAVETAVLDTVKEQLNRRQPMENITRNFLRLLTSVCGIVEVRVLVSPRLEVWLQNPKLMRAAQELLMSVCVNSVSHTQKDVEVISALVKIRLKTKPLMNCYLACIRELVSAHNDNLATVLKHTIYNELSQSRNPNNMSMLSVMFQYDPDQSAALFADIIQELLVNRDDYLRPVRFLVRELCRVLRSELSLPALCRGLMGRTEPLPRDCEHSRRAFSATADLIGLAILLAVAQHSRHDKKESQPPLEKMQLMVSGIQSDAVWWLHETALRIYRPTPSDFVHALHKVLVMEPAEQYYKVDLWPPEPDRAQLLRLASEVPLLQSTLVRTLAIGLSKEHPLAAPDALELADQLVRRAAAVPPNDNLPMLRVEKLEIMDLVFNLSAYHHPEKIDLPADYCPPALTITNLYWKGWTLLLVLAAHNPATLGAAAWRQYPTLRALMEMCITNQFVFPAAPDTDLQLIAVEKQTILEFESHLAAASTKTVITEQTSHLLLQLMSNQPGGPARRPPTTVLETLKGINALLRLGHLLCRSRHPDFLLDIIQHQGASQSMPWLADLVHTSDSALSNLPVQCLCEFLLSSSGGGQGSSSKEPAKYQQLLAHLQGLLVDPAQDPIVVCEVLDYFLRRLSSPKNRAQAITGLKLVLSSVNDEEAMDTGTKDELVGTKDDASWLLRQLPMLPHFHEARPQVVGALRSACQVENEPSLVTAYLRFLACHVPSNNLSEMTDLAVDMAQLIVERSTIMAAVLPADQSRPNPALDALISIFYNFVSKARSPGHEVYSWSESQDQILVTWPNGEQSTMHILVVHANVILLTYGPQAVSLRTQYVYLIDAWFPIERDQMPKAFLVDTIEEALLIPDWLKLRMIRSCVSRLVEAALTDLEPPQLILFIQSFGIPVDSMSKLLETLDRAVLVDEATVSEAVLDKAYMIQLVEVQHRRGAMGGQLFARLLGPPPPPPPTADPPPTLMDIDANVALDGEEEAPVAPLKAPMPRRMTQGEAVAALDRVFAIAIPATEVDRHALRELSSTLQRSIAFQLRGEDKPGALVKSLVEHLLRRMMLDRTTVAAVLSASQFACPLFRLLTSAAVDCIGDFGDKLAMLAEAILGDSAAQTEDLSAYTKTLIGMLRQFLLKCQAKHRKKDSPAQWKPEMKKTPIEVLSEATPSQLERAGRALIQCEDHSTETLVEAFGQLLVEQQGGPTTGLIIDWLLQVEPHIVGSSVPLQMKFLFSRSDGKLQGAEQCRPYLLTLLTHHASWDTLCRCTNILLQPDATLQYDATAVLDFLWALTHHPKLWLGHDKHTPDDVLRVPSAQVMCLADYIVEEAVALMAVDVTLMAEALDKMNTRLALLSQCLGSGDGEKRLVADLARHLTKQADTAIGKQSEMYRQLLVQLYLRIPSIVNQLPDFDLDKYIDNTAISVSGSSSLDSMSHTVITALTATPLSKDWPRRSQDLELSARKMAATHPLLVLRQLPMVAASLRGRVHLEYCVFRSRSHLALFQQVMGLLELLQPRLFLPEYAVPLHQTFDAFFALVKHHGLQAPQLVNRFVALLQSYISIDPDRAITYLQKQVSLLSELQGYHRALGSLCIMTQPSLSAGVRGEGGLVVSMPPTAESLPPMLDKVITMLHSEDVLPALQELDQWSVKRAGLLEPAVEAMCRLLSAPTSPVRSLAHALLARYLRHHPPAAIRALPAYMACLDSACPDVVTTALDRLPELIVCSQEMAVPLLQKVFCLGMCRSYNTAACITKTIGLLNLQTGC